MTGGAVKLFPRLVKGQTKKLLSREELDLLKEAEKSDFMQVMQSKIDCIDNIYNPTGILRYIDKFYDNPNIGEKVFNEFGFKSYNYKNEDLFVFNVTDHISLLQQERNPNTKEMMSKHQTMALFSTDYCLNKFCRKYNSIVLNVQQQDASSEELNFYRGSIIEESLFPSLDHLANNKEVSRDYDVVVGLYSPYRYGLEDSFGYPYRTDSIRDGRSFRWIGLLKDRLSGQEALRMPLYFEGSNFWFEELPSRRELKDQIDRLENYPKYLNK